MRHFGSSLVLLAVGVGSLVGASGCELQECETEEGKSALCAKSLTRFVGEEERQTLPYTAGTDLTVNGIYGEINLFAGTAGEVEVVFEPFNYRAHDAEDAARDELENNFDRSFELSSGALVVTTGRHDATNGLGSNIDVYLPPEFDGAIVVRNDSDGPVNPGKIDVEFVGAAWSVDVSTDDLGDCNIDGSDSVVSTRAHCDGAITVTGVSDEVDIASTGLSGDVAVVMTAIASAESGGSIMTEDGDIDLTFPADAEFSVQAQSTEDGRVSAASLDEACIGDVAAESAKSYTCGAGGPNFVVTAGTDGVGPSSVSLELR
ncbi:MAG TPA: DUF4097 family beta strand repeat-containing protein [Polyangiaceae bacterium]